MTLLYNFFTENAVAKMYGPDFLLLYIAFIGVVYFIGNYIKIGFEKEFSNSNITIATLPEPDPYLLTYLRAGVSETTKIVTFNLFERGYLRASPHQRSIGHKPGHPSIENLDELEKTIFEHIGHSKRVEEVVDYLGMLKTADTIYKSKIANSDFKQLFFEGDSLTKFETLKGWMRAIILAFGGYKLVIALATGHDNVIILIGLMTVATWLVENLINPSRLTEAGQKYLKDLKQVYTSKYSNGIVKATSNYKLLLAAVLGVSVIRELGYGFLIEYTRMKPTQYDSSGSCASSSCSGGSSCGSSCGGGCGGGCGGCS